MTAKFFDSIIILRFGKTKVVKEEFQRVKNLIKIWDVDVDNMVISKLIERKIEFKYFPGYLDEVIRPLVLILTKMSGYVKTSKDKDNDNDKNKNKSNKLIHFRIDNYKLLEKHKII